MNSIQAPVKILNKSLILILIAIIFASCDFKAKEGTEDSEIKTKKLEADIQTARLEISGMTCEIGCAKLIQSKLYKTDGVSFAEIHFADSSGLVTYDANRLSKQDIVNVVEKAGGGDLYEVNSISPVEVPETPESLKETAD